MKTFRVEVQVLSHIKIVVFHLKAIVNKIEPYSVEPPIVEHVFKHFLHSLIELSHFCVIGYTNWRVINFSFNVINKGTKKKNVK
jgi:hypothetical protein